MEDYLSDLVSVNRFRGVAGGYRPQQLLYAFEERDGKILLGHKLDAYAFTQQSLVVMCCELGASVDKAIKHVNNDMKTGHEVTASIAEYYAYSGMSHQV